MTTPLTKLSSLAIGERAHIVQTGESEISHRLREMGFVEGAVVELKHEGPFGDPLAVLVRGTLLGLRRNEADLIQVIKIETSNDSGKIG